ncbi:ATP-binding protein [Trinickia mobilis]|uniref:ATP-binding protein n=1 Tax=Trinickia mobilis TaxID=2816356 RepID=UPI001A8E29C1|nr:winged helix-turn-helix domain-containing protein [Trinickia mobilis]
MVQIGKLHVNLERREVSRDGAPLRIGSRAFDVLGHLIEANGALVSKEDLISRVWPETIVEENNLQVQITVLRKALGEDRDLIRTVPGRGYQLVGSGTHLPGRRCVAQRDAIRNLPAQMDLIGRESAVDEITAMLAQAPLVTLVGAGGIGKTSLAIRVAREFGHRFAGGVHFIELAPLSEPGTVLVAVAEACGMRCASGAISAPHIAGALAHSPCLVVLDNAEHVVDVVAGLVDALLPYYPEVNVLVTSREPLRVAGESIYRVRPLEVAADDAPIEHLLSSSAVQLFVRRARALACDLGTDARSVRLIGAICRRLDGIPLGIELAAARAVALGVAGVYAHLDDRLQLLAGGHRNALPRHQTLRATFDWSYALLDAMSRKVFRRLGVFAGVFTFEAICAVAGDRDMAAARVITSISELTEKSLLNVEFEDGVARYRLPESTRAYALEKLRDEGELQSVTERHARFLQQRFDRGLPAERWSRKRTAQSDFRQALDDARGTFDWAFSAEGNPQLGIALASALAGPLLECSLLDECRTRAGRAVAAIEDLPAGSVDASCEMRLCAALAYALLHTSGPVSRAAQLWQRALALAAQAGDLEDRSRALCGLWNTMLTSADIHAAMECATRYQQFAAAQGTEWHRILGEQLVAVTQHCLGMHDEARASLERGLARLDRDVPRAKLAVDPLIFMNGTLARIEWLQGRPEHAMTLVNRAVDRVRGVALEPSLSHVLAVVAVPLALMTGDVLAADRYLDILRSQVTLHRFDVWREYCDCLGVYRDLLSGRGEHALPVLEAALDALLARGFRRLLTPLQAACAQALAACGRIEEAKARLAEAQAFCAQHGEQLFVPELWRAMGIVELEDARHTRAGERSDAHEERARQCFETAIRIATEQGAIMWMLRSTIALARLCVLQGRRAEASCRLQAFTSTFDAQSGASDVRELYALADELRPAGAAVQGLPAEAEERAVSSRAGQPPPSDL